MYGPTDEQWRMLKWFAAIVVAAVFGVGVLIGWWFA